MGGGMELQADGESHSVNRPAGGSLRALRWGTARAETGAQAGGAEPSLRSKG
jgi:hypothetical protein